MALNSTACPWFGFWLSSVDDFTFQSDWITDNSYYINNNDTIWVLGFQFASFNTVGINQSYRDQERINLYPNPASDIIHFDLKYISQEADLLIYNSLGQVVRQVSIDKGKRNMQVEIASLLNGVYFYSVIEESGKRTSGKFIKK